MIHEIGVELQAVLRSRGCPLSVIDGSDDMPTVTYARERIVIERFGDDSFGPVRSQHLNPKHRMTRSIGCKITIYAQAVAVGALTWEHYRRAETILDLVLVALGDVAAVRHNLFSPKSGRFINPEDLEKSETNIGAVYELLFTFDRAVRTQTWLGAFRPSATLTAAGGLRNTTKVSMTGGPDDDDNNTTVPAAAETACGA